LYMGSAASRATVYTLPDCAKCEELKEWLSGEGVEFNVKAFDTEAQLEFIMRNEFGNPPILVRGEKFAPSEVLFPNEVLDEGKAKEILVHGEA
jgi:arsenate reductase-like glutaredoxin family protein